MTPVKQSTLLKIVVVSACVAIFHSGYAQVEREGALKKWGEVVYSADRAVAYRAAVPAVRPDIITIPFLGGERQLLAVKTDHVTPGIELTRTQLQQLQDLLKKRDVLELPVEDRATSQCVFHADLKVIFSNRSGAKAELQVCFNCEIFAQLSEGVLIDDRHFDYIRGDMLRYAREVFVHDGYFAAVKNRTNRIVTPKERADAEKMLENFPQRKG